MFKKLIIASFILTCTFSLTTNSTASATTADELLSGYSNVDEDRPQTSHVSHKGGNDPNIIVTDDVDHGTLDMSDTGYYTYTPDPNFNGNDGFTYSYVDAYSGETVDGNTMGFSVRAINDAPVAKDASVTTNYNTKTTVTVSATDVEGDSLTYSIDEKPDHGTVTNNGSSFTYTPDPNYSGRDSFTYTVSDGTNTSTQTDTGTVSITVKAEPVDNTTPPSDSNNSSNSSGDNSNNGTNGANSTSVDNTSTTSTSENNDTVTENTEEPSDNTTNTDTESGATSIASGNTNEEMDSTTQSTTENNTSNSDETDDQRITNRGLIIIGVIAATATGIGIYYFRQHGKTQK